jgi:hypothetical protein
MPPHEASISALTGGRALAERDLQPGGDKRRSPLGIIRFASQADKAQSEKKIVSCRTTGFPIVLWIESERNPRNDELQSSIAD